jgi:imidazole glycerol-phosphate synthase subunit HisF
MLLTRVMPCLLLKDGSLVKTVKFKNPSYVGDPINAIRIYNEKEVDELIVLDITATLERREPPFAQIEEIARECFMPVAYGGGVGRIEHLKRLFSLGVEKVAINTSAVENPQFIRTAADTFGSQSIVVSIDVKKDLLGRYQVYTNGGRKATGLDPVKFAIHVQEMGAGEILLTSMDRDGTMEGYDIELIKKVSSAVQLPVIACGGAGKVADFVAAVKQGGASAVAAGSMVVYHGRHRAVLINFPPRRELEHALA